jgi:DivIVA domain-containing protein
MNQDQFTLTPQDVRAQGFARSLRGYDRLEVEAFRSRVADELERLLASAPSSTSAFATPRSSCAPSASGSAP